MQSTSKDMINWKAWVLALRPKTLIAGAIPILVGSFAPTLPLHQIDWRVFGSACIVSVFLTIAANLINDALDFKKGADTAARIGPIRVTQTGLLSEYQVLGAGFAMLAFALLASLPLITKGGLLVCIFIITSLFSAYFYTGGPYPISYHGLGELFVILYYGFGAVLTTYYLQAGFLNADAFLAATQVGLLATVLIAINNLRDIQEDTLTGKKTLAVCFGAAFAKKELILLITLPFILNLYWYFTGRFLAFFLPSTALLIAINLIRGIWRHEPSKLYNRYLGEAALLLAIFGIMLILGLHAN